MDSTRSNGEGQRLKNGAGKEKGEKNRNQDGQQNAHYSQKMFDNNVKANPEQQQKNQEQNSKQRKDDTKLEKDGISQIFKNTKQYPSQPKQDQPNNIKQQPVQQNQVQPEDIKQQPIKQKHDQPETAKQQTSQQKQDQLMSPKKQPEKQKLNQSENMKQQPSQEKQDQPKSTKKEPKKQKKDQPKNIQSKIAQKQSTDQTSPETDIASQKEQQIEQQISMFKTNLIIPKRKSTKSGGGTLGRKTEVDVNYLLLNLDKLFKKTVYQMNVQFMPDVPRRLLRNALEEFVQINYPNTQMVFDGQSNMYTTKELKGKSDVVQILNDNGNIIDFTITTFPVSTINMSKIEEYIRNGSSNKIPGEAFQALDIVLKNRPFSLRFVNAGRSFFSVPRITPIDLGGGMELWKGFFQSPVIGWKPFLNIDVAHKEFPKHQTLVAYIVDDLRCNLHSQLDSRSLDTLAKYVKGLKVSFMIPNQPHSKRSLKVNGLLDTADRFQFDMDDKKLNVVQYFRLHRNYTIKYPHLPCLHVGNVNKKYAIPIELCTIQKGQANFKKMTQNQTANMVKYAARPPIERQQTIENCIKDIKYNNDNVLKDFGIEVDNKFTSVPARVLDQPFLAYKNKETQPKGGVWKAETFSVAVVLKKWVVLNLDFHTKFQSIKDFEQNLIRIGRDLNFIVNPMDPVITLTLERSWRLPEIQKRIIDIFNKTKKDNVDLVVVVIPKIPAGVYATVKQSSELTVGILTQCIKSDTMLKIYPSIFRNILLKINSKLNGVNHTLSTKSSPLCMKESIIFGADVCHPSADQTNVPSIAAVSASHDLHGSQYNMEWCLQSPNVEIIQDLEDIIYKQLLKFKDKTKCVPRKIFYFRDGVSERQFSQLLEIELVSIRRACLRLNINYKPPVTFLVVQRRHHTRMFPVDCQDMDGKCGNVPSGTVVDTQITHPTEVDFYLCSHASIQGTSKPTKYHLLWDENDLTEDALEQLTFYLCFMFARCTRSVSYPAPTYYAHLAAYRARTYFENKTININRLDAEQIKNQLNEVFIKNNPMFFI